MSDSISRFYESNRRVFDELGISKRGARAFMMAATRDQEGSFSALLASTVEGGVFSLAGDADEGVYTKEKLTLTVVLTSEQQGKIQMMYGDYFDLSFSSSESVGHPMAYALRIAETEIIMSLLDHNHRICDAGGNYAHHAKRIRCGVHCCNPILSHQDMLRASARLFVLKTLLKSSNPKRAAHARRVMANFQDFSCDRKAEFCTVPCKSMMWVHSIYDMKVQDIAIQMDAHQSEVGYGCFMYSDAVHDSKQGVLPDVDARFNTEGEDVVFYFENDASFIYRHKRVEYLQFCFDHVLKTDNNSYYYRVFQTTRNTMMFTVTKMDVTVHVPVMRADRRLIKDRIPLVTIDVFDIDMTRSVADDRFVVKRKLSIPSDFYSECMSIALTRMRDTSDYENYTREAFLRAVKTQNRVQDVNGIQLAGLSRVSVNDLADISTALFVRATYLTAYRRFRMGMTLSQLQGLRKLTTTGFFQNFSRYFRTYLPNFDTAKGCIDAFYAMLSKGAAEKLLWVDVEEETDYHMQMNVHCSGSVTTGYSDSFEVNPPGDRYDNLVLTDVDKSILAKVMLREGKSASVCSTAFASASEQDTLVNEEVLDSLDEPEQSTAEVRMLALGFNHDPADRIDADKYRKKAIDEYVSYVKLDAEKTYKAIVSLCQDTWNGSTPNESRILSKRETIEQPNYLMVRNGVVVSSIVPRTAEGYMFGYDPNKKRLVKLACDTASGSLLRWRANHEGWLFVCQGLTVFNSERIVNRVEAHLNKRGYGDLPVVEFYRGVAGCGKTRICVRAFDPNFMFLCATKSTTLETRERVKAWYLESTGTVLSDDMLQSRICTVDAFVLNSFQRSTTLYVDEAVLLHWGNVMIAASMVGAERLVVLGDDKQIPMVNRWSAYMEFKYSSLIYFDHYRFYYVSFRMPQDVTAAANKYFYGGEARTVSKVRHSMSEVRISDEKEGVAIQTFSKVELVMGPYKFEKARIKGNFDAKIATVHESQGNDVDTAALVRLVTKGDVELYSKCPHALVALSRHKKSLVRLNAGPDDFCSTFIEYGMAADLEAVKYGGSMMKTYTEYF